MMKRSIVKRKIGIAAAVCFVIAALLALPLILIHPAEQADSSIRIGATFGPVSAILRGMTEDAQGLTVDQLIAPQDICLRSYPLSDWDLYAMSGGYDLIAYGGCGLEGFSDVILALGDYGVASFGLIDASYLTECTSQDPDSHFSGPNPHAYLSLSGTKHMIETAASALCALDPAQRELYLANASEMLTAISGLESEIPDLSDHCAGILNEALIYPALDCSLAIAFQYERECGEEVTGNALSDLIGEAKAAGISTLFIECQAPARMVESLEAAGFTVVRLKTMSDLNGDFDDYIAALDFNIRAIQTAYLPEEA